MTFQEWLKKVVKMNQVKFWAENKTVEQQVRSAQSFKIANVKEGSPGLI